VTGDGLKNEIINGSADWVYEEEFEVTKAFYWSPNNDKIAFLKFDEREVKEYTMDYYSGNTYPSPYTFKYPKAGEDNSKLNLFIYDIAANKSEKVNTGNFEYIPRMKWSTAENKLVFLGMNRHQNELSYVISEVKPSGAIEGRVFYTDKSDTYVEVDNNLEFLKDGSSFLRTSEKSGFRHIYKVDFNGVETQITTGNWDVIELVGVDQKKQIVYYTSAEEGAMYQSLYSISLDGKKKTKLSSRKGHNDVEFSNGMKYFVNYYSNANEVSKTRCFEKRIYYHSWSRA
jgi:dipeptidyl-peptidase 4